MKNVRRHLIVTVALVGAITAVSGLPSVAHARDAARDPFRIGIVVAGDVPAVDGVEGIRAAFSAALAMPVEVIAARDFRALVEAHLDGRVDYAVYSAQAYAAASLRCSCVQPVAMPLGERGAVGVRSILIARRGAELNRIAMGPADSLTGHLVPAASWPLAGEMARKEGVEVVQSLGSAEDMFVAGAVDGFFGWVPAWRDGAAPMVGGTLARLRMAGLGGGDYEVVWQSEAIPYGPHAVRADIPPETLRRLQTMILAIPSGEGGLEASMGGRGGGFAAVSGQDYRAVIDAVAALHGVRATD